MKDVVFTPKPEWLRIRIQSNQKQNEVMELLNKLSLNTVCNDANCPNLMECFGKGTATFMILGRNCTRNCTFCCVTKNEPDQVDENEPYHLAEAVNHLSLKHVVITSVTRDDLPDGGAGHFVSVIKAIREKNPETRIEVLIPDFMGDNEALKSVVEAKPDIINHNLETVPRLYSEVRPMAVYQRSLELLKKVKQMDPAIFTKSGIMVGLGEKEEEVLSLMDDLRKVDCDFLTVGQYLAPSKKHHPVVEYIHPDIFQLYQEAAEDKGFIYVASAPLVRSSYQAEKAVK